MCKCRRTLFRRFPVVALAVGSALSVPALWSADRLTNERALATVKQCVGNNGAPRVLGVQDNQNGAVADVQFTNFQTRNYLTGNLTEVGHADFAHYNDGRWVLRIISIGRWEVTCNTTVGSTSSGSASADTATGASVGVNSRPTPSAQNGGVEGLVDAAQAGDLARVKALIASGVKPNVVFDFSGTGRTPLAEAARRGRPEVVEYLMSVGADPSFGDFARNGAPAFYEATGYAMDTGKYEILNSMLKKKKPAQEMKDELLVYVAENADLGLVKLFLAEGANPQAKAKRDGKTALARATAQAQILSVRAYDRDKAKIAIYAEIVQLLKQRGATQ